jgi:hypothetical protein
MIRLYLWFCRVLFCCTRTMGAVGTRPSLRPLSIREGHASDINSGVIRREIAKACLGCLKIKSWYGACGQADQAVTHRKNASSRMMMRANPKFDHKTAMIIASA